MLKNFCLSIIDKLEYLLLSNNIELQPESTIPFFKSLYESSEPVVAHAEFIVEVCRLMRLIDNNITFSFLPLKVPQKHLINLSNDDSYYIISETNVDLCTPVRKYIYEEILSKLIQLELL